MEDHKECASPLRGIDEFGQICGLRDRTINEAKFPSCFQGQRYFFSCPRNVIVKIQHHMCDQVLRLIPRSQIKWWRETNRVRPPTFLSLPIIFTFTDILMGRKITKKANQYAIFNSHREATKIKCKPCPTLCRNWTQLKYLVLWTRLLESGFYLGSLRG